VKSIGRLPVEAISQPKSACVIIEFEAADDRAGELAEKLADVLIAEGGQYANFGVGDDIVAVLAGKVSAIAAVTKPAAPRSPSTASRSAVRPINSTGQSSSQRHGVVAPRACRSCAAMKAGSVSYSKACQKPRSRPGFRFTTL
jgi:hypothetical protein